MKESLVFKRYRSYFSSNYKDGVPFPITVKRFLSYIKYRGRSLSTFQEHIIGLENHPKHGPEWVRQIRNSNEVLSLIDTYDNRLKVNNRNHMSLRSIWNMEEYNNNLKNNKIKLNKGITYGDNTAVCMEVRGPKNKGFMVTASPIPQPVRQQPVMPTTSSAPARNIDEEYCVSEEFADIWYDDTFDLEQQQQQTDNQSEISFDDDKELEKAIDEHIQSSAENQHNYKFLENFDFGNLEYFQSSVLPEYDEYTGGDYDMDSVQSAESDDHRDKEDQDSLIDDHHHQVEKNEKNTDGEEEEEDDDDADSAVTFNDYVHNINNNIISSDEDDDDDDIIDDSQSIEDNGNDTNMDDDLDIIMNDNTNNEEKEGEDAAGPEVHIKQRHFNSNKKTYVIQKVYPSPPPEYVAPFIVPDEKHYEDNVEYEPVVKIKRNKKLKSLFSTKKKVQERRKPKEIEKRKPKEIEKRKSRVVIVVPDSNIDDSNDVGYGYNNNSENNEEDAMIEGEEKNQNRGREKKVKEKKKVVKRKRTAVATKATTHSVRRNSNSALVQIDLGHDLAFNITKERDLEISAEEYNRLKESKLLGLFKKRLAIRNLSIK